MSVVGGVLTITSLVDMTPYIPPFIGITILVIGIILASFLAYLDLYRKSQSVNIQTQNVYNLQPRDKKTDISTNVTLRYNFKEQMMRLHGAEDYYGIKRDIENNVIPLDKILEQKCTICGEPRNKWKGEGHKI